MQENSSGGFYPSQEENRADKTLCLEHLRGRIDRITAKVGDDKDWLRVRQLIEDAWFDSESARTHYYRRTSNSLLLRALPYSEYLRTHHWQALSKSVKKIAGFKCVVCNAGGELHAHHRTYERVGFEDDADVVCLCKECHATFHNRMEIGA